MQKELAATPVGSEFPVPIVRAHDHVHVRADTISAQTLPIGEMELSILQFRGRLVAQKFDSTFEMDAT